jgi:hypothetical protein
MAKMTTEEAFVKVLQMHGIEHALWNNRLSFHAYLRYFS